MSTRRNVAGALVLVALLGGGLVLMQRIGYPLESFLPGGVVAVVDSVGGAMSPPTPVLEVPPAEMRSGLAAAYRLGPDRRYLLAIGDIHQLVTGKEARPAEASFAAGTWTVRYRGELVDTIPELANYGDWQALLVGWARQLDREHPLGLNASSAGDSVFENQLRQFDAVQALRVLTTINMRWRQDWLGRSAGARHAADLSAAARALVIMRLQGLDAAGIADAFDARVLATLAMAQAFSTADVRREDALMAHTLRQDAYALAAVATLPEQDPVRLYVTRADESLLALASAADATPEAHYLYLLRLGSHSKLPQLAHWQRAWYPRQVSLALAKPAIDAWDFGVDAVVAPQLPYLTVAVIASELNHSRLGAGDILGEDGSPALALDRDRFRLGLGFNELSGILESSLAELGAGVDGPLLPGTDVGAYYRGIFYSGLYHAGRQRVDGLSSADAAADFSKYLGSPGEETAAEFARWYAGIAAAKQGHPDVTKLAEDLASLQMLGRLPMERTFRELMDHLNIAEPRVFAAARTLTGRLDDRVEGRKMLAGVAFTRLMDLSLYERLQRSIVVAGGDTEVVIPFASFTGDSATLKELLESEQLPPTSRIVLPGYLLELGMEEQDVDAAYRRIVDVHGNDWHVLEPYVKFLEQARRYPDAREQLQRWLANHAPDAGFDYIYASTALARQFYLEGRYQEGLDVITPVVPSYQGGALLRAALLLERLGAHEDAVGVARAAVERYPDSSSASATLMEIYWRQGRFADAANVVTQTRYRFGMEGWREDIGTAFVEVFREDPRNAVAAFDALMQARVSQDDLRHVTANVHQAKLYDLAFRLESKFSAPGLQMLEFLMTSYGDLRLAQGGAAADAWLRKQVPPQPYLNALSMFAYSTGEYDALWTVIDKPEQGQAPDAVWLYRAAAHVRAGKPAGQRADALAAHFSAPGDEYYHLLGRYLLGMAKAEEVYEQATTAGKRCELAHFFGVRAESEGRNYEAAEWYRVAIETGLYREGEYRWSMDRLLAWNNKGVSLSRAGQSVYVVKD